MSGLSARPHDPETCRRIISGIEEQAKESFPGKPLKEALRLFFERATDAKASYAAASKFLEEHCAAETEKRLRSEARDEFYRGDGAALYERHVRNTTGDTRLRRDEIALLFDDIACAELVAFVKSATGNDDDAAALNTIYANAPQLYEERHAAIRAAVAGRPEAEVIEHVARAHELAKRIVRIAKSAAATDDPGRVIREGASR